jgi:hypothetical protein
VYAYKYNSGYWAHVNIVGACEAEYSIEVPATWIDGFINSAVESYITWDFGGTEHSSLRSYMGNMAYEYTKRVVYCGLLYGLLGSQ